MFASINIWQSGAYSTLFNIEGFCKFNTQNLEAEKSHAPTILSKINNHTKRVHMPVEQAMKQL